MRLVDAEMTSSTPSWCTQMAQNTARVCRVLPFSSNRKLVSTLSLSLPGQETTLNRALRWRETLGSHHCCYHQPQSKSHSEKVLEMSFLIKTPCVTSFHSHRLSNDHLTSYSLEQIVAKCDVLWFLCNRTSCVLFY